MILTESLPEYRRKEERKMDKRERESSTGLFSKPFFFNPLMISTVSTKSVKDNDKEDKQTTNHPLLRHLSYPLMSL